MTGKLLTLILFLFFGIHISGQSPVIREQVNALNIYVDYTNECLHGMLIAHRLFENYNQDINKYVDLPGHQLNFYNNQDLPLNIFEDPDHWFYEVSPEELYQRILVNNKIRPEKELHSLIETTKSIHTLTNSLNGLRLEIGDFINQNDLSVVDSLNHVYTLLERSVDLYDLAFAQTLNLENQIKKTSDIVFSDEKNMNFISLSQLLTDIHEASQQAIFSLKNNDLDQLNLKTDKLKRAIKGLEAYAISSENGFASKKYINARKKIIDNATQIISMIDEFINNPSVPVEYVLYKKNYYYYNSKIINKINRFGNGLTPYINQIIDLLSLSMAHRLESPHFLKIIYPDKIEKPVQLIRSSNPEITKTPIVLNDRKVVSVDKNHEIWVDGYETTLEIFDHLLQDGDIISLNFNGDWIFENLSLESKPKKFILKLNRSGKNYLVLHAVNEGKKPPNTIGINYVHKGRKKRFNLQSNLQTSQMVEIKIDE